MFKAYLFLFLLFSINSYGSLVETECPSMISTIKSEFSPSYIQGLQDRCENRSHMATEQTQAEAAAQMRACDEVARLRLEYDAYYQTCSEKMPHRIECQNTGGIWNNSKMNQSTGMPWEGMCEENCPGNTSLAWDASNNISVCQCPEGSAVNTIPVNSVSLDMCGAVVNVDNKCPETNFLSTPQQIEESNACNQHKTRAEEAARVAAMRDLQNQIASHEQYCGTEVQKVQNECRDPIPIGNANPNTQSTLDQCRALENNASADLQSIGSCRSEISNVLSMCSEARGFSSSPQTVAPFQGISFDSITVNASELDDELSFIGEVASILEQVNSSLSGQETLASNARDQAAACIARIEDQEEVDESLAADDSVEAAPDAIPLDESSEGDTSDFAVAPTGNTELGADGENSQKSGALGYLAQGAGLVTGLFGGGSSDPNPGSGVPTSPGFFSGADNNIDPTVGGTGAGGPASANYAQSTSNFINSEDPFIPGPDARAIENPDSIGTLSNAGGSQGGGGSGFGGGSSRSGQAGDTGRGGKRRALAKAKNLINGHKRNKQTDGGGRKGTLRGSSSVQAKRLAYQKAIKQFGKNVPLKFDGSKYVPDLKAMKNSRNFRARNARAVAMYNGQKVVPELSLDQKLLKADINPNANHRLFKTMNIYFRRNFKNSSSANGLNL